MFSDRADCDTVSWTINVAHTGTSNADAFNVDLQNLINSATNHLSYITTSFVVTPAGGAVTGTTSDFGGDLTLDFTEFPLGARASITFDTLVQLSAPTSATLTNDATIQWTSLPGDIDTAQSSVVSVGTSLTVGTPTITSSDRDHRLGRRVCKRLVMLIHAERAVDEGLGKKSS